MDWACHPQSPPPSHPDRHFSLPVSLVSPVPPWKRRLEESTSILVITHLLTRTCLRCRISSLRQYRAAVALKVIVGEIPVVRSVARPFWSPLLEPYCSEAELLSNGLGSTI